MFGTFTESLLHKVRRTSRGMDKGESKSKSNWNGKSLNFRASALSKDGSNGRYTDMRAHTSLAADSYAYPFRKKATIMKLLREGENTLIKAFLSSPLWLEYRFREVAYESDDSGAAD